MKKITVIVGTFAGMLILSGVFFLSRSPFRVMPALAESDDRYESGDGDYSASSSSSGSDSSSSKTVTQMITTYVTKQVPVTSVVIPPEYVTDTDGDGLVDAIDPDPKVPQKDYFTDDDGDGVANALDRHPGEDDFTYIDATADANGIIGALLPSGTTVQ